MSQRLLIVLLLVFLSCCMASSCIHSRRSSAGQQDVRRRAAVILQFRAMDTNRDGRVGREEFRGPPEKFDMLDVNGDGVITLQELEGRIESGRQVKPSPSPMTSSRGARRAERVELDFGLCVTPTELQRDKHRIKELGITAVRLPAPWQFIEPEEGRFDWQRADSVIKELRGMGLQILLNVRSVSEWGTRKEAEKTGGYRSSSMPRDLGQWERFLGSLARRYKGMGVHYEIENEVSAEAFWSGSKAEYLELLERSYSVIKAEDPEALVLCAAMPCGITRDFSGPDNPQFRALHDDWLLSYLPSKAFDAVSVHNYYFPDGPVVNGFTFRTYQEHVQDLMRRAGVGGKRVWITEAGYVSQTTSARGRRDESSPGQQAEWIEEAVYQASKLGVERIFWILLRDRDEPYFGAMGLADSAGNPRPAWHVIQELSSADGPRGLR